MRTRQDGFFDHAHGCQITQTPIHKLINEVFPRFRSNWDKHIFLVFGASGAGKSTLLHYLLSQELELRKVQFSSKIYSTTGEDTEPRIGHGTISKTRWAEPFATASGYTFMDTASLKLNLFFSTEQYICSCIALELSMKMAKGIQGILIVDDIYHLENSRYSEWDDVVFLEQLFGNSFANVLQSTFYVINRNTAPLTVEERKAAFLDLIDHKIKANESMLKQQNVNLQWRTILQKEMDNFILLRERSDCSLIIDMLDKGQDRDYILEKIRHFPVIENTTPLIEGGFFNVDPTDAKHENFYTILNHYIDKLSENAVQFEKEIKMTAIFLKSLVTLLPCDPVYTLQARLEDLIMQKVEVILQLQQ